jgi:hypothetical protein
LPENERTQLEEILFKGNENLDWTNYLQIIIPESYAST